MQHLRISILLAIILAQSPSSMGAYYDTLPKGVRAMDFRYITTSNVNSAFGTQSTESSYDYKLSLDAGSLSGVNEEFSDIFEYLKSVSPDAYKNFTFGAYDLKGQGRVSARVLGFGYGISNATTVYFGVPFYKANVTLDIKRTKGNNHKEVTGILSTANNSAEVQILAEFMSELPDGNGELLQSVMVNQLGYKPVGDWSAESFGDTEIGIMHRLASWRYAGIAIAGGAIIPTGREDDPDIIQDIPFGDGQADVFFEFGGGVTIPNSKLSFDSHARLTYQFAKNKTLRIAENADFTHIASEKGEFKEKLGNKLEYYVSTSYEFANWINVTSEYQYSFINQSEYKSQYYEANKIMAANSEVEAHIGKFSLNFSTISFFKKGDFFLPMTAGISGRRIFAGRNTPQYTRYDLELRFFF